MQRILILGHTGKMGTALMNAFRDSPFEIVGKNRKHFDASNYKSVKGLMNDVKPFIVINSVAYLGIDPCEQNRELAYRVNSLYPYNLATLATHYRFLLVHFSSDAVFDGERTTYPYTEMDGLRPVNYYGITKAQGDWGVSQYARQYYIFRLSILFGPSHRGGQFVEKMLRWAKERDEIRIADDIIMSPSYSRDIAAEVKRLIEKRMPYGTYHLANKGTASLKELSEEIIQNLGLNVRVVGASHKDFPHIGRKNLCTPLSSWKIDTLRPWREAVKDYCLELQGKSS